MMKTHAFLQFAFLILAGIAAAQGADDAPSATVLASEGTLKASDWIQLAVAAFTAAAAIAAWRAAYATSKGVKQNQRIAEVNVQPSLRIYKIGYEHRKGLVLKNAGLGPAIVTSGQFSRADDRPVNCARDAFNFGQDFSWDDYWTFAKDETYGLSAGEEISLALLSLESLERQVGKEVAVAILKRWDEQLSGLEARIKYRDLYEKELLDCTRSF